MRRKEAVQRHLGFRESAGAEEQLAPRERDRGERWIERLGTVEVQKRRLCLAMMAEQFAAAQM